MNNINKLLIERSFQHAFSIIAGLSTIAGLWGYTIKDINDDLSWWKWGIIRKRSINIERLRRILAQI